MRHLKRAIALTLVLVLCSCGGLNVRPTVGTKRSNPQGWQHQASTAICQAMADLGMPKGTPDLLAVTNAGYASVNGESSRALADIAMEQTGCTVGKGSLLFAHAPQAAPVWVSLFDRDTYGAVFIKWRDGAFRRQALSLHPDHILEPARWKKASDGLVGDNLFQVVSFSLVWSTDPPWGLLKSAELHNHICPGLNAGYVVGQYIKERFPLHEGERYAFVAAPPACPVDALQTVFDATAGKRSMFNVPMSEARLARHGFTDVQPTAIVLRVHEQADTCDGAVLGFDWQQACSEAGIDRSDFAPPGGPANPIFFIARAKAA